MTRIVVGKEVVSWVASRTNEYGNFGCATGIGLERDGSIIAGVAYAEWNGVNVVCHIASDGSKRWMTRRFLWTIFDYPFNQLNVKRITCCIGEGNKPSIKLCEHMGFERGNPERRPSERRFVNIFPEKASVPVVKHGAFQ